MKTLLIIEMGVPPLSVHQKCGSHADWFISALQPLADKMSTPVCRPYLGETLQEPASLSGAIITGSWSMVTDREGWSEYTAQWFRTAMQAQLPVFGVCYGHQLMAHALGGTIGDNPEGLEIGTHTITLDAAAQTDPLLSQHTQTFDAYLLHQQSVLKPPAGAVSLATSDLDRHQILRYAPNTYSVQFHPEFSEAVMRASIEDLARAPGHGAEHTPIAAQTPFSRQILLSFCDIVLTAQQN